MGRFPVVIYAPSFSASSFENADLCEYLASHGYVVIAAPDMGATTRYMTMNLEGANTQARDISFLIGYAQTLPNTEMSEVAVAGCTSRRDDSALAFLHAGKYTLGRA